MRDGHVLFNGRGSAELANGAIAFVRDAKPGESVTVDFDYLPIKPTGCNFIPDTKTGKLVGLIGPGVLASEDVSRINLDTLAHDPDASQKPFEYLVDPKTGLPIDGILPDGSASYSVGPNDHVVLIIRGTGIVKGTKAEMLDGKVRSLANLPAKVLDQVCVEIAALDPSKEMMVVFLSPDGCNARRVPWSAMP